MATLSKYIDMPSTSKSDLQAIVSSSSPPRIQGLKAIDPSRVYFLLKTK